MCIQNTCTRIQYHGKLKIGKLNMMDDGIKTCKHIFDFLVMKQKSCKNANKNTTLSDSTI